MLRFNTFRSERYLRSKFVEGKYLLASEATDLELEVLDLLRKVVNSTIGDVAIEDAFKVERLSDTQILIKPGQAWFKGLPFAMRGGKDQLVTGAILSLGTVPVGTTATDDSTGLGKVITFNSGSTTPSALYRIVITAREELITEVDDPFLQNVNLTESTAQKVRLNFQLNIVPESLQTESPVPYRDESSASGSVTNFPNAGGMAAPNYVNQIQVTGSPAGNGELIALNPISGSEGIDGRDLEAVIRNNPGLGGGNPIPNSPTAQQAFSNGKLIDSYGNKYHVNAIFNDTVSTQVVIRIDKEPDQPNPQFVNGLPFTLVKREVYVTDDANGVPQGRLHWPVATLEWDSSDGIVHSSKVVDLRTSVSKEDESQMYSELRDSLEMVGGGNVSFNLTSSILTWPEAFNIVNPHGALQTIAAGLAPLIDGGSLAYEMDLLAGGAIGRGTLAVTVSSGGMTATLASVDLSDVRLGNILVDSAGDLHVITDIDNVNDTVSASTSIATGAATIYKDAFGPGMAPRSNQTFILAVRSGNDVLVGGEEEESKFEDRNLKLVRGGTWSWGGSGSVPGNLAALVATGSSINFIVAPTNHRRGQRFLATQNGDVTSASMYLEQSGGAGTVVLEIWSDSVGFPGALLGTSDPVTVSSIYNGTIPYPAQAFTFSTPVTGLLAGTHYHLVLNATSMSAGTMQFAGSSADPYSDGYAIFSNNGGVSYSDTSPEDHGFSIDGLVAGPADELTWTADAFISIPGLTEDRNTILAGSVTLANDGEVAYVNINRDPGAPANLTVQVAAIEDLVSTEDLVIIARRTGAKVIVGNQSTLLEQGQSSELYAQMSEEQKAFMGGGPADSTEFSSNTYVTDGDSLETAIGDLDAAVAAVSGVVGAISWKAPVANFAALPASGNTDGDVRLTLDTRLIYTWKTSVTAWVETGTFKAPVATFASLPSSNNVDGDIRIVLDTRLMYSWVNSLTQWIPVSGSGGSVKATFLDPISTSLPSGTSVTIDGISGVNGDLVLFTNLSSGNNIVYKLGGVGVSLTWTPELLFNGSSSPSNGDSVRVLKGNAFAQQLAVFDGTDFKVNDVIRYFDGVSGDFWEQSSLKTTTLSDNTTGNIFTVAYAGSENIVVNYSLIRGSLKETGQLMLTTDGTSVAITRTSAYLGSTGVTFTAQISGSDLLLDYATTNLGSSATMKYHVSRWSDSSGGPTGIPSYSGGGGGGGSAAGINTDIQYNNAGSLAGDSRFQWDSANAALDLNDLQFVVLSSGITLNDNQVSPATLFSYNASNFRYAIVEYSAVRNGDYRVGRMLISNNGTTTGFSDDFVETSSTGLNFSASISGANVVVEYTSTSTGFTSTFKYTIRRWN